MLSFIIAVQMVELTFTGYLIFVMVIGIEELEDDESLAIKCIKNGAFKFFREVFISSRTFQEEVRLVLQREG